jgi:hypothetical protein
LAWLIGYLMTMYQMGQEDDAFSEMQIGREIKSDGEW